MGFEAIAGARWRCRCTGFMGRVKATDVRPTDGVPARKILRPLIARYHTLLTHGCVQRR